MTDAAPAAPAVPDEEDSYIDFRPSGGLHVVIEGQKRRLRSPRMRDYRKLVGIWRDEAETLERKSEELQGFLERMLSSQEERKAKGESAAITDEERAEDRKLGQEVRELTEDAALRWWVECLRTLGVSPSDCDVEPDELPVFCATVDSVNLTLDHWRTVPSRSGVR